MSSRFNHLEGLGNRMNIPIPRDENGFLGRECPVLECEGYFKVKPGTGLSGPDLLCHCPYCGHSGDPNTFWTKEQIEYAKSVALSEITDAIRKDLKQFEFNYPAKGAFGIGISMKLQPGVPIPIRHYREKRLETEVTCDSCTLQYSVFGLFAYCPDCRVHNSLQVLQRNLALVKKQLELATTLDNAELATHLIEDALENCVSAFDGFGRESCRVRAEKSSQPGRALAISFQNLAKAAVKMKEYFGVDLERSVAPADWRIVLLAFLKRHVIAHKSGVTDERYCIASGDPAATPGRRVVVTANDVEQVAGIVEKLGIALVAVLPAP